MDETDNALIAALRRNARASLSDLGAALGVTRATVRARLARLERLGEVQGYTVLTRADSAGAPVRGLMMVQAEARATDRVMARLAGLAFVTAVHSTNGRWDLIVDIAVTDLAAFDAALAAIRQIDGVTASETSLLLSTRLARRL